MAQIVFRALFPCVDFFTPPLSFEVADVERGSHVFTDKIKNTHS